MKKGPVFLTHSVVHICDICMLCPLIYRYAAGFRFRHGVVNVNAMKLAGELLCLGLNLNQVTLSPRSVDSLSACEMTAGNSYRASTKTMYSNSRSTAF